jgi:hypothetical protein
MAFQLPFHKSQTIVWYAPGQVWGLYQRVRPMHARDSMLARGQSAIMPEVLPGAVA